MTNLVKIATLLFIAMLFSTDQAVAQRTRLEARLGGPTLASGKAKFEQRGRRMKYNVELEDALRNTTYTVVIKRGASSMNGGAIRTNRFGFGEIDLDTTEGDQLRQLREGDVVQILIGNRVVVSGRLRAR